MIKKNGVKLTANEYAKILVSDKGDLADYWLDNESRDEDIKAMTKKEKEDIEEAIIKHQKRVYKYLNISKIYKKIYD